MPTANQLWFLLGEQIQSQAFTQVKITLDQIKENGINLSGILSQLLLHEPEEQYSFFMHSASMKAAVQMLTDRSIHATWQLYCQNDPVVTIVVRKAQDPSPNTSRAPSYSMALVERRKVSGPLTVPELPIHAPPDKISSGIDTFSMQPLEDLPETEKVVIADDHGDANAFSKDYLTSWINSQIEDGKILTDIVAQTTGADGQLKSVRLTKAVWEQSLIRGPWSADFRPVWAKYTDATAHRETMLAKLRDSVPNFTQSCVEFICDLRTFSGNKASRNRLDTTGHEFFLGLPYFDGKTRDSILQLRTMGSNVERDLRALAQKRLGAEICASHDLAPLFERVLGVSWDKERGKALSSQHMMGTAEIMSQGSALKTLKQKGSKFFKDTIGRKKGGGRGGKGGSSSSGGRASEA
ncbi:MAG: hypothetical protein Q9178_003887 [Gyalolechia marmorata]